MTEFTTRHCRRIEADTTGFEVTCTASDTTLHVALNPEERRRLADALTGGLWSLQDIARLRTDLAKQPPARQWTRDDLPHAQWLHDTFYDKPDSAMDALERIACDLVAHLNANHPKPELRVTANVAETDAALRSELMGAYGARDRMRVLLGEAERERDAAVERAEIAEREVIASRQDALDAAPAVSRADLKRALTVHRRMAFGVPVVSVEEAVEIVAGLLSGSDPAVYVVRESDLPEVLKSSDGENWRAGTHSWLTCVSASELRESIPMTLGLVAAKEAAARAIEAEQAVDPVEAKAQELWEVARFEDGDEWSGLLQVERDCYRRMAAHVLGQEAE